MIKKLLLYYIEFNILIKSLTQCQVAPDQYNGSTELDIKFQEGHAISKCTQFLFFTNSFKNNHALIHPGLYFSVHKFLKSAISEL
jgi:hypothetical protein